MTNIGLRDDLLGQQETETGLHGMDSVHIPIRYQTEHNLNVVSSSKGSMNARTTGDRNAHIGYVL